MIVVEENKDGKENKRPTSGYKLNEERSVCSNGVKPKLEGNNLRLTNMTKGSTSCYLYFDKQTIPPTVETIVGDTTNKVEKVEFSGIATEADTGIYSAPDDYGTSYYFRGVEDKLNNWVEFAGFYWRIIRINGNGTVRMIYAGAANGNPSNANRTGTTTQINGTTYAYNLTNNDNTYVGYMKSQNNSGNSLSYSGAHSNLYDSNAKATIDSWYKTNIVDKGFSSYVDTNTGFCNDRQIDKTAHSSYQGDGYGTQQTAYAPWGRLYQNSVWKTTQTPTLQCANKERDLFTLTSANIGNKKLTYPVGLISSDEVVFGRGFGAANNITYYLYTNRIYWTMSPYRYPYAVMFTVDSNGHISNNNVNYTAAGLRPVINLRADTNFTGDGSESNPFVVV